MNNKHDEMKQRALLTEQEEERQALMDELRAHSSHDHAQLQGMSELALSLKDMSRAEAPAGITDAVMKRLDGLEAEKTSIFGRRFSRVAGMRFLAACFFLASLFHAALGILLERAVSNPSLALALPKWITIQPLFALIMGVLFFILAVFLTMGRESVVRVSYILTVSYVLFSVANGMTISLSLQYSYFTLSLVGLTAWALSISLFLGGMALKFAELYQEGGVSGNTRRTTKKLLKENNLYCF